jgi:hypothetical protein
MQLNLADVLRWIAKELMQIYQIRDAAVLWDEARGTAALADVVLRWEGIGRLGEITW